MLKSCFQDAFELISAYCQMCVVAMLFFVMMGAGQVCAAPEGRSEWPSERELIRAMQLGVKERKDEPEAMSIRSVHQVTVGKKEDALLVSVWLHDRARNFSSGTFLYRPRLKQARELDYSQSLGATYLPGHFNEFLTLQRYGSGQGDEDFQQFLVRFDGWQLHVLHETAFANNLGNCGDASSGLRLCEQTWVQFQMLVGDKPDLVDMVEVTTRLDGSLPQGKLSVASRRFRLIGQRFKLV